MNEKSIRLDDFTQLGKMIRYHRKRANLTQKELADLADVGKTVIYDLEKGKVTVQFKIVLSILKVLNIQLYLQSKLIEDYLLQ